MALPYPQLNGGKGILLPGANEAQRTVAAFRAYQAQMRYPTLLHGLWDQQHGILIRRERVESGLITLAVQHHALSPAALRALGEFRLHQYILCGWYDLHKVVADKAQTDPQLASISEGSIHIITGTRAGQILAYCTLQEAAAHHRSKAAALDQQKACSMQDAPSHRPLFACEAELFGPRIFATLPALRAIPLAAIGELNCLLRNQTLVSPLSTVGVVEAIVTMIQVITHSSSMFQVILGASDMESRRVLAALKIPVLYAPLAKIAVHTLPYKHYWAATEVGEPAQGKYWPFAVAVDDLRAHLDHFEALDQMLSGSVREASRALVMLRRQGRPHEPETLVPPQDTEFFWISDPFFTMKVN